MKIGILTLPLHNNYGGILQAYALQRVLQKLGHDAMVIDRERYIRLPLYRKGLSYCKRLIKKIITDRSLAIQWDKEYNHNINIMRKNTYPFLLKHINRIVIKKNYNELNSYNFDAFVVGSDQVWRPWYFGRNIIADAFLSFTKGKDVKRISYAASFGTEEWEYTPIQTNKCKELIKRFDAVSVREDSAVKLCKEHLDVDALHVLDPSMLLNAEEYINLFESAATSKSKGTLMCYILDADTNKDKLIANVATTLNLKPFSVNSKYEIPNAPIEERIQPPVEEWIRGFYDAEYIITDSFHACVFAILFKKPFIVYGNKERGMARFLSLLKIFGLEDRLVLNAQNAEKVINKPINWNTVDIKLAEWRNKSLDFISKNL
ncbi:MAG: polysaccharide pyruvyl transferase family protein [Bacteroidaceae bacterium]|nr:polysaccharide pyruvyl transferase family protein [Bacteroidaceae bacterium]